MKNVLEGLFSGGTVRSSLVGFAAVAAMAALDQSEAQAQDGYYNPYPAGNQPKIQIVKPVNATSPAQSSRGLLGNRFPGVDNAITHMANGAGVVTRKTGDVIASIGNGVANGGQPKAAQQGAIQVPKVFNAKAAHDQLTADMKAKITLSPSRLRDARSAYKRSGIKDTAIEAWLGIVNNADANPKNETAPD